MLFTFCFRRVLEYINSGRDKDVVDPDQFKIYSKRKKRRQLQRQVHDEEQPYTSVEYPKSGWSTDLRRMPLFSRAELDEHISQCGKNIDPKSKNHSVPTGLKKAKTYLEDEYFKNIV